MSSSKSDIKIDLVDNVTGTHMELAPLDADDPSITIYVTTGDGEVALRLELLLDDFILAAKALDSWRPRRAT